MSELTATPQSRYTFDNADPEASRRVRLLAADLDAHSIRVLEGLGVAAGWHCLDVGPGAGTITAWLAGRVGPAGRVTALDIDPRHVEGGPNVEIVQDDINTADLPTGRYDLIHARLVLMHLPARERILRSLAAALRPGGRLVISDWDTSQRHGLLLNQSPEAGEAFDAYHDALAELVLGNGGDLTWAKRVPLAMREAGLTQIVGEADSRLAAGGEPGCLLHAANTYQLEGALLANGMTPRQIEAVRRTMQDPGTLVYSYWMYTTVGRRPENPDH